MSASLIMSARARGASRRGGRGGGGDCRGVHGCGGCGRGGGHGSGSGHPSNSSTVGERYPPISYMLRGQRFEFFTLDQTADVVFPAVSVVRRDTLTDDAVPATYNDGYLQGAIQFLPPQDDANRVDIMG